MWGYSLEAMNINYYAGTFEDFSHPTNFQGIHVANLYTCRGGDMRVKGSSDSSVRLYLPTLTNINCQLPL